MDTLDLLLRHFDNRPFVALREAGAMWGHSEKTMKEKIDDGQIRLPYFTVDNRQKSIKLVRVSDMARILNERAHQAELEFQKLWSAPAP